MATIRKIHAGLLAKRNGQNFEAKFESLCRARGVNFVRIPDGCRRVGGNRLIRVQSPFDYCLCFNGKCAHIDTKSTKDNNFSYSKLNFQQLNSMAKLAGGGPAGYVARLGDDRVWFIPVEVAMETKPNSSVDIGRCIFLGCSALFNVRLIFN